MKYVRIVALCGTAIMLPGVAFAAPAPAPAADAAMAADDQQAIGDIVVTAQRRDEGLSKVPVSVTVLSSETLAKSQVFSEADLQLAAPGLAVRASLNSNQLNYSLRGQSQDAFSGTRPGVLPYFNEVQIAGGGSTGFYDLQSIQVLKGPQGTLFGRSATGGAVLFSSVKPGDEFGGYLNLTGGQRNAFRAEGAVDVPIAGEALRARVSAFHQRRDGYQFNLYVNQNVGRIERTGARLSLSSTLSAFTNDFVFDYYNSDSQSTVTVLSGIQPFPGPVAGGPPFIPLAFLYAGTSTPVQSATGIGTATAFLTPAFLPPGVTPATATPAQLAAAQATASSLATPFYNAYFSDPRRPNVGLAGYLAIQQARGPYVISSDANNFYKANNYIISNTSTLDLGNDVKLKNVFGYASLSSLAAQDADGTPYGIAGDNIGQRLPVRQISNELQLLGGAPGDRFTYVAGVYFSREKSTNIGPNEYFDLLLGGQFTNNDSTIRTTTWAGYGQGTYKLTDSLSATVGLRYTSEKVALEILPTDTNFPLCTSQPTIYRCNQADTYNRLSWQLGLQNQVTPNLLLYAVTRRAYKAGGFNGIVAPRVGFADTAGNAYRAEQLTDVEGGVKYLESVGGVPIRASLAVFHNWLSNSQRSSYTVVAGAPAVVTVNVPEGRTWGFEFDGQVRPAEWLSLGGSVNYINARFTNGIVNANGAQQIFDQVPDTPEWSGTLFAEVTVPVSEKWSAVLGGDLYAQSATVITAQSINANGTRIGSYEIANFRVGLEDKDRGLSLTASLRNAFDRVYYVGGIPTGNIYQANALVPGEPRSWTIQARLKF